MTPSFSDATDFEDAGRGYLGALSPGVVRAADGRVVWDGDAYDFLAKDCPDTVHPSLWRQAQLVSRQGLYEVTTGVYQVRGLDLSNVTFIEGEQGIIVVDPLISAETAAAALDLYQLHRGERPVTGVIYTHSHVDHFGGVEGVVSKAEVAARNVPILAPQGFLEHAVSENVYAGTAMARRSAYMYGAGLPKGPTGQVGAGLGQTTSTGTVGLVPPNLSIERTGQEETVDGVRFVFQLTPGTEAPAELNFYLPAVRALCMAENATHTLHNILTLRGALVRDPRIWARYLTESIELFARQADVVFASHHWPCWGTDNLVEFLSLQRDLYAYLHDQTLRLINQGYVGAEIAERLSLPPALDSAWHARGYYGSVSHNVKAIYQRYMGWFDGNPAHLWEYPPVETARRYVEYMGGADAVLARARHSFTEGDYRWVAQVVNHVVFAEPGNDSARELQAAALEQLGYGAENGTWRNFYLTGAMELRGQFVGTPTETGGAGMVAALTIEQIFDSLAVRIDGPRAWDVRMTLLWRFTDSGEQYTMLLRNGVLTHVAGHSTVVDEPDVVIELGRATLNRLLVCPADARELVSSGTVGVTGDASKLTELFALLDSVNPSFAIVTP